MSIRCAFTMRYKVCIHHATILLELCHVISSIFFSLLYVLLLVCLHLWWCVQYIITAPSRATYVCRLDVSLTEPCLLGGGRSPLYASCIKGMLDYVMIRLNQYQ